MTLSRMLPTVFFLAGVAAAQPSPPAPPPAPAPRAIAAPAAAPTPFDAAPPIAPRAARPPFGAAPAAPPPAPRAMAARFEADQPTPSPTPMAAPAPFHGAETPAPAPPPAPRAMAARFEADQPTPPPTPMAAPAPFAEMPEPPMPPNPPQTPAPAGVAEPPLPPLPPDAAIALDQDRFFEMQDKLLDMQDKFDFKFNFDMDKQMAMVKDRLADLKLKFPTFAPQAMGKVRTMSDDRAYELGQRALEGHRYAEALEDFNQVASRGGTRADGAWYWKAYSLIKLGRQDEARAALAELRKSYPSSRWLDDAKALEVEAGKPVTPESESDEELKLIALNGLMQSDPDRALPLLENMLKSAQPPKIKRNAIYVLAQSSSPKAQQLLEQVARGEGNPDLQLTAIRYLGEHRRQGGSNPVLAEIYASSNDANVKLAILNAFQSARDKDRLLQIAKTEKQPDLRLHAIRLLGSIQGTQADLWSLYQSETTPEGKQQILESMPSTGNLDKMLEVARTERDPKIRRFAIQSLSTPRAASAGDTLAGAYATEQDQTVKRAIIDALASQKNVKAMIQIARGEKDPAMQRRILDRLVNMKSPEATDYLMEIIKK